MVEVGAGQCTGSCILPILVNDISLFKNAKEMSWFTI